MGSFFEGDVGADVGCQLVSWISWIRGSKNIIAADTINWRSGINQIHPFYTFSGLNHF